MRPIRRQYTKRALDFPLAVTFLIFFLPLFLILALLVAMDGGPIFYAHRRVGEGGRIFNCYKFRTMLVGAEECLVEYLQLHPTAAIEWRSTQSWMSIRESPASGSCCARPVLMNYHNC